MFGIWWCNPDANWNRVQWWCAKQCRRSDEELRKRARLSFLISRLLFVFLRLKKCGKAKMFVILDLFEQWPCMGLRRLVVWFRYWRLCHALHYALDMPRFSCLTRSFPSSILLNKASVYVVIGVDHVFVFAVSHQQRTRWVSFLSKGGVLSGLRCTSWFCILFSYCVRGSHFYW